jgi:hypothetical protein
MYIVLVPFDWTRALSHVWFFFVQYGFQSDTLVVSVVGRHIVYAGYTRKGSSSYERIKNAKIHRVMNKKKPNM